LAKNISIKEAGKDEYWLQDQIYDDPNCLGLGELESISKEKRQSSGGRLDLLLKDSEDDTMYEVEVMLGETDESHIIRTIEYWDNEARRWPQRQHFAVLIAEHITRRFFNVIHLLSNSIPIIAIQVSLIEVHGKQALYFSKILDTYEEIEDGTTESVKTTREDWIKKSNWTLETSEYLYEMCKNIFNESSLNYLKGYIGIMVGGTNYLWLSNISHNKSSMGIKIKEDYCEKVTEILDKCNLSYTQKRNKFKLGIDMNALEQNKESFIKIIEMINECFSL
jgi:hypothetical protein